MDEKKIKQRNIMQGNAHQLKGLEFAKQTILLFCLSVHRGSAGKGCQLHPMKAKIRIGQIIYRIVQMHPHLPGFVCSYAYLYPSVRSSVRPSIQSSVPPSNLPSVSPSVNHFICLSAPPPDPSVKIDVFC